MYITIDKAKYPCAGRPVASADTVTFTGVAGLPESVTGPITLCADNDFELASYDTADWLRVVADGETLTLTNLPEPEPPGPEPEPDPTVISDSEALAILLGGEASV